MWNKCSYHESHPCRPWPFPPSQADVADNDERLVELWLHGRSPHTQRAYRADAHRFRVILVPARVFEPLLALRRGAPSEEPVFAGRHAAQWMSQTSD